MANTVLVAGGSGTLGSALGRLLGSGAVLLGPSKLDVTDRDRVHRLVAALKPQAVVNCAALTDVDLCQQKPELAMRVHRDGVANLADTGVRLVTISTDHVFRGDGMPDPYLESSPTDPINEYGRSKLAGEEIALQAEGTVVRTSFLFGGRRGLIPFLWRNLTSRDEVRAVSDQRACATWAEDLAAGILRLLEEDVRGVVHMANQGAFSPLDIARLLRGMHGGGSVKSIRWTDLNVVAPRPAWSVLGSERGLMLRPLVDALKGWRASNGSVR